jgi:hypothetical protein
MGNLKNPVFGYNSAKINIPAPTNNLILVLLVGKALE